MPPSGSLATCPTTRTGFFVSLASTYPLGVALDEWDILYTKNEFCITTANDAKHTFAIDMHVDGNASINASICEGDQRKVIASTTLRPKDGVVSGEIADFFLLKNHKSALSVGAKFYLRYSAGGKDYEAELQLSTVDAPTGVSAPSSRYQHVSGVRGSSSRIPHRKKTCRGQWPQAQG